MIEFAILLGPIALFAFCFYLHEYEEAEQRRIAALLTPEQLNKRISIAEYFGDIEILNDELARRQEGQA